MGLHALSVVAAPPPRLLLHQGHRINEEAQPFLPGVGRHRHRYSERTSRGTPCPQLRTLRFIVCGDGLHKCRLSHLYAAVVSVSGSIGFDPSDFTDGTSANLLHAFIAPGWRRSMFYRHGPPLSLSRQGPNKKSVKKCAFGTAGWTRTINYPIISRGLYH